MINKLFTLFFILFSLLAFGQEKNYPQNYFASPVDIPIVLAGTFGELRPNHFHSGIDIKTQQKEGLNILATADGYVSRIKVSNWGFGKALYITHPNGYTTVYAHLKKFDDKIEAYVKKNQYKKESYSIQLYPKANEFTVKKGERIAFSGSTGGYVSAHLHYEIRETKNAIPINPMLFGLRAKDTKSPSILSLFAYPSSYDAQVNQSGKPVRINLKKQKGGDFLADSVIASGRIGFGISVFDQLNDANNHNGIYELDAFVDGKQIYHHNLEKFSFGETRYINLLIDYERFKTEKHRVQQCFIDPNNNMSICDRQFPEMGYIHVEDGKEYLVEIIASDFDGNTSKVTIPLIGRIAPITIPKEEIITNYAIDASSFNEFNKNGITVAFPKNTFYEDLYLQFENNTDGSVQVHPETVPLKRTYTLTFDVSQYSDADKKHLFIAHHNKKYRNYSSTKRKNNKLYTVTKKLGTFSLQTDYKPPTIEPVSFFDGQWISNHKYLKVKIDDDLSGISSYRGEIDGKWILLEWDLKKKQLVYDFSDLKLQGDSKHQLKIVVKDNANNTKTYTATFYRKIKG